MAHYRKPGWFTVNVFNRSVMALTRAGVSVFGSRILAVRGRRTGEWRSVPVNLLAIGTERYLVAPRGESHWVRNLRAAGEGELVLGRSREAFVAEEIGDDDKPEILRAYLRRWKVEVGVFFGGVGPGSTPEELRSIAPEHPVFRVLEAKAHL